MKMKKILCLVIAVVMVVLACPIGAFADSASTKASGVQSSAATDAQITSGVVSIWYMNDGVETKQADYDNMDAAFEGLRALYAGPLADTTIVDTNENGLSDELYAAAGSPVIKLNGNFQGDYARPNWATNDGDNQIPYDMNKVITIVIDGAKSETENYTITYGKAGSDYNTQVFNYLAYYNLTVKNTNIIINRGTNTSDNNFLWQGNSGDGGAPGTSYTIFENCFIQQNSTLSNSDQGGLFKMNGKAKADTAAGGIDPCETDKFNLILRDTTVESGVAVGLQVHWGADANIELYNSTMALIGTAGKANNNDSLLKFYEAGDGKIYLDGTSKLISKRGTGCGTATLIRTNGTQYYPVDITLESGAELSMQNTGALTTTTYMALNGPKFTVTDNGAVYTASANDAKNGVTLPGYFYDEYLIAHIWKANGTKVTTSVYKDAEATADVVFVHEKVDDSAFAEATDSVAYIEMSTGAKLYFNSIQGAVNHLNSIYAAVTTKNITDEALWEAAGSPVVCVYKNDLTVDATIIPNWWNSNYDANRVRTVYIKGVTSDNTQLNITSTINGAFIQYNAYYNLTLENINLNCTRGFALFWSGYHGGCNSGKSTTSMIDCYIKATGTNGEEGNEGLIFKVTGNKKADSKTENYIINMINTDVFAPAGAGLTNSSGKDIDGVNAVFLFHHGCAGELNIDGNSSIKHYNSRQQAGGDTMFMLGSPRYFDINVAAGAELFGRGVTVADGNYYSIFNLENSNTYPAENGKEKVTLNIEDGANITVSAAATSTAAVYGINNRLVSSTAKYKFNFGASFAFKFDTNALAVGGGYITGNDVLGDSFKTIGYKLTSGETVDFQANGDFAKDKYTEELSIAPVLISSADFSVAEGAAVMMHEGKGAIRFTTNVSDNLLKMLDGCEVTFYTVAMLESGLDPDIYTAPDRVIGKPYGVQMQSTADKWLTSEDETMHTYYATLADIDATAENFVTSIAFRSYVKVKYSNNVSEYIYTDFDADLHTRSMYEVAKNLTDAGKGTEATQTIIDTVAAASAN